MNDYLSLGVKLTDAEIIEKLEILRLEKGISTHSFVIKSITEKLRKEGYLPEIKSHTKKEAQKKRDEFFEMILNVDFRRRG